MLAIPLKILRVINTAMLAAGLAALVSTITFWPAAGRYAWMAAVRRFSLTIGLVFLVCSAGAFLLMPRTAEILRQVPVPEGHNRRPSTMATLLLTILAAAAILQLPGIFAWWAEDRALLRQLLGTGSDPFGFSIIPTAALYSMPAIAALCVLTFVISSIFGILGHAEVAFRVLLACVLLQTGLVGGEHVILQAVRDAGVVLLREMAATNADQTAVSTATDWIARHDAAVGSLAWRLVWILGGYVVAAILFEAAAPARSVQTVGSTSETTEPSTSEWAQPPMPAIPKPSANPPSRAAGAFDYSTYAVRPKLNLLTSMLRMTPDCEIRTIPPMSRIRFSYSPRTRMIRREPDGPDLIEVRPSERSGVFGARSHEVIDATTGMPIGRLVPRGADWEIHDTTGEPIAHVLEESLGAGYVAKIGDREVCRFTWARQGLSVFSAELEVDFPNTDGLPFDRALGMAIAPMLEHKARLASERSNR